LKIADNPQASKFAEETMNTCQALGAKLKELEIKRKNGEITLKEFYQGLLNIIVELKELLVEEQITEKEAMKQVPLILVFIHTQIQDLFQRGG